MKLLLDQDIYARTIVFLRSTGHDVVLVAELGQAEGDDSELLAIAQDQGRIFVTRDRDFGNLVFVNDLGAGVIYLRISPSTLTTVHLELEKVLNTYSQDELQKAFVVIEPGRHRFRRLPR